MERLDAPAERSGRSSRSFPTKRRRLPRRRALVAAAFVPAALGLLALILTVGAVQTVGAAILPGCPGFRAAVLKVRIHLPPAESPRTIGFLPHMTPSAACIAPGVRGACGSRSFAHVTQFTKGAAASLARISARSERRYPGDQLGWRN